MLANTVEAGVEVRLLSKDRGAGARMGRGLGGVIHRAFFFLSLPCPHRPSIWISG